MDIDYILRNSAGNLYWKDITGKYCGANQTFTDLMNAQVNNGFIGKTDREIFSVMNEEKINIIEQTDQRIMQTGKEESLREEGVDIYGKKAYYFTKKIPLHDKNGKISGIMGTSLDITREMQAEIAKTDFISNMEHDLRTPFVGIGGIADLLYSLYSSKYPELKELLQILVKSCSQWQIIHNRIFEALDLQQDIKIEPFYIQDEIEKIKELMGSVSQLKQVDFIIKEKSRKETGQITTDNLKFNLILSSLVGNAFNFTEKGRVTVKVGSTDSAFVIEVTDTGIGIPDNKLNYIFEKFTKLSRSNTYGSVFKGMGMGLYNAKKDAEKIKGSISVSSKFGNGSTFTLTLPRIITLDESI
ncbi:MAG: PAS domain-containing protein [Tatlockia sp.]|nr:PAS domain-containing protein [Tatlockia sp.]